MCPAHTAGQYSHAYMSCITTVLTTEILFPTDLCVQKYWRLHFSTSSLYTEHETIPWWMCVMDSQAQNWLVHFPS